MVSKNLHVGTKIVILVKYWYLVEYLKVRESLYTQVIIWVNTNPNHIDTRKTLPRYENSCMIDPNGIENKNDLKYPYPTSILKREILITDT